mgnify:CR=1 FL=1
MWMKPGMVKNKETSVEFDNGMMIIAEATTANAARGKSLKFVYCVDGKTKITIRHKQTGEIKEIDIEDLDGNSYIFGWPRLKFTTYGRDTSENDVTQSLAFQALGGDPMTTM